MRRDIWVIDWKSSTGIYDEMKTQVSCYLKMDGQATRAGIVRLDKVTGQLDDPPLVEVTDSETRWESFVHLREYFRKMVEPYAKNERWYPYEGEKFPTITTILDVLNKKALPQWSSNMAVDYIKENLFNPNDVIIDCENIKFWNNKKEIVEYHLKKAKTAYRTMSKAAMDTGSIVHDAIHAYLSGAKPEPIIGDNDKAETAFLAFLEWNKKVELEPIALEKILINPEIKIGGTCDFIGWANI